MRHVRWISIAAIVLGASGCYDQHGTDEDAGPPVIPDGSPPLWTDCWSAFSGGISGDPCRFDGTCGDPFDCGGPSGREAMCVGGTLRFIERTCTLAPWETCTDYLERGGNPGDACFEDSFGRCDDEEADCCGRSVTCESGFVRDDFWCHDGCVTPELCDDYEPRPGATECHAQSECDASIGEVCLPTDAPPVCGACRPNEHACEGDGDCASGEVCVEQDFTCGCFGDTVRVCAAACVPGSCAGDEACDTGTGRCEPISCTEGFACPANTRCVTEAGPGRPALDEHGCWRLGCASDFDCDCGACVDGTCRSGPGYCQGPVP